MTETPPHKTPREVATLGDVYRSGDVLYGLGSPLKFSRGAVRTATNRVFAKMPKDDYRKQVVVATHAARRLLDDPDTKEMTNSMMVPLFANVTVSVTNSTAQITIRKRVLSKHVMFRIRQLMQSILKARYQKNWDSIPKLAEDLQKTAGSLRCACQVLNYTWSYFLRLTKVPVSKSLRTITKTQVEVMQEIFLRQDHALTLPSIRHADKAYARFPLHEIHQRYIIEASIIGERILSKSSCYRHLRKVLQPMCKTPFKECLCLMCLNMRLLIDALRAAEVKGIAESQTDNLLLSLCAPTDSNAVHNGDRLAIGDCKRECVFRECTHCGRLKMDEEIQHRNPEFNWLKMVNWELWERKNDPVTKKVVEFNMFQHTGAVIELLQVFLEHSHKQAKHLFHYKFQEGEFQYIMSHLEPGDVLAVEDFASNRASKQTDEPQSAHWHHRQVTMHPIVIYYRCPIDGCVKVVKEELIFFTNDLQHDAYAVKAFEDRMIRYCRSSGIQLKRLIVFSDNCGVQYKSKVPFDLLSKRTFPVIRNFYGQYHGKGPADAAIGRINKLLKAHVASGRCTLQSASDLLLHCKKNKSLCPDKPPMQECWHVQRVQFFLIEEIWHPKKEDSNAVTIPGTLQIHSVRTTGIPGFVEVRDNSCFCQRCLNGQDVPCPNASYVLDFVRKRTRESVKDRSIQFPNRHFSSPTPEETGGAVTREKLPAEDSASEEDSEREGSDSESEASPPPVKTPAKRRGRPAKQTATKKATNFTNLRRMQTRRTASGKCYCCVTVYCLPSNKKNKIKIK